MDVSVKDSPTCFSRTQAVQPKHVSDVKMWFSFDDVSPLRHSRIQTSDSFVRELEQRSAGSEEIRRQGHAGLQRGRHIGINEVPGVTCRSLLRPVSSESGPVMHVRIHGPAESASLPGAGSIFEGQVQTLLIRIIPT